MNEPLTRREQLEADIVELERKVEEATTAWAMATYNRDQVQIKETEERLIEATTALNALKMRRPI